MAPRYYDLSEDVVPAQGAEAIADTPSAESPTATTDGERNTGKETDVTSLDSNPENEDETRKSDDRTDVTNLASRRAKSKKSNPVPRLSSQDFSNVLRHIDRFSNANPTSDFGQVVVAGVRDYSYRANKNGLNILAAVVPILIRSGNFDNDDLKSLRELNNQVSATRRQADDGMGGAGLSMDNVKPSSDISPPMSGGQPDPSSPAGAGAVPGDPSGGGAPPATGGAGADPTGGAGGGAGDPTMPGAGAGAPGAGDPTAVSAPPPDPNSAGTTGSIRRGRSRKSAGKTLHFDIGEKNPLRVQHVADNGNGTSLIVNEHGRRELVANVDLYYDVKMAHSVTKPYRKADGGSTWDHMENGHKQPAPGGPTPPPKPGTDPGLDPNAPDPFSGMPGGNPNAPAHPDDMQAQHDLGVAGDSHHGSRRHAGDDDDDKDKDDDKDAPSEGNSTDEWLQNQGRGDGQHEARRRRTAEDNLGVAKQDTDTTDVEKPNADTDAEAQQGQYDRGKYDQNGPLLTNPDKSTDQNWPPKASSVDAIRLADMYVDLGLITADQKYQVMAGFEKMNSFIVKDRLKVLSAVSDKVKKSTPQKTRSMVPQSTSNGASTGKMPSFARGASKNGQYDGGDHFLAL